jgi:general stress protein 26
VTIASHTGAEPESVMTHKVLAILEQGREATLATLRPDGWPQATVINYVNDDKSLYFDCLVASQKAQNIARDDRVSLALIVPYEASGPILGLSLSGHAKLVDAPADRSHVIGLWKIRYPYMREQLDQDLCEFAFFAITPTVVSFPDYTAGLGHR